MILEKAWWNFIKDEESYLMLVSSGMAWEFFPELPGSWKECEDELKESRKEDDE